MNRWLLAHAALPLALAGSLAQAQQAYVTLDDFSSDSIDAERWTSLDRVRTVSGNSLNLALREAGGTGSDSGTVTVHWTQPLTVPHPVTQLKAQLRVNSYELGSCAANPAASEVRARLYGTFFNTGSPTPGSMLGDMFAQIRVRRMSDSSDPPGVFRVDTYLGVCNDTECTAARMIGPSLSLGTVGVGQNIVLQLEWDKAGRKFVFARDNYAQKAEVSYTQNDSIQASRSMKVVAVRTDLENCASGPQVIGHIDARFDNVSVNSRAIP